MAGKGEGRGGKDIEQTAQLSRRGAMSCESEEKDERGRYAAKKVSVWRTFLNVRRLRTLRNVPTFSLFYGFNVHFWLCRT